MQLTKSEILKATKGQLFGRDCENVVMNSLSTDTRKIKPSDWYLALRGPNFDGHYFVHEAVSKGAAGVIISAGDADMPDSICVLRVGDTLKALGDLAHEWRKKIKVPLIGLTGSSGKTSTKEMIATCLGEQKRKIFKTEGNLNNLIGVPQTLFSFPEKSDACIVEMGMNAFGEIKRLTEIADPDIALITNVGRAHLEGVGGTIEGVQKAKGELFATVRNNATCLVNLDDALVAAIPVKSSRLTYGFHPQAEIRCEGFEIKDDGMKVLTKTPDGKFDFFLPIVGKHHITNFLASLAIAYLLKYPFAEIAENVKNLRPAKMRGEEIMVKNEVVVINDVYNANPDSTLASIKMMTLKYPERRKVAILGDMLELGEKSEELHRELGQKAKENFVDQIVGIGTLSKSTVEGFGSGLHVASADELKGKIGQLIKPRDVVLVKGSRGSRMETVVEMLKDIEMAKDKK